MCFGILSGNLSGILSHMCSGPVVLVHRVRSWRYGVRAQACPQHPDLAIRGPVEGVLAFGARDMGFGSAASGAGGEVRVTRHSKGGDEEKDEEEWSCTFVKIWRPSLAGVEKQNLSLFPLSA